MFVSVSWYQLLSFVYGPRSEWKDAEASVTDAAEFTGVKEIAADDNESF